jgi:hypothetical protein
MNIKDFKKKMKKDMGWRWYWMRLKLMFDLEHQRDMRALRRELRLPVDTNN